MRCVISGSFCCLILKFQGPCFFLWTWGGWSDRLALLPPLPIFFRIFEIFFYYYWGGWWWDRLALLAPVALPPSPVSPLFFIRGPEKWLYLWKVDITAICCLSSFSSLQLFCNWSRGTYYKLNNDMMLRLRLRLVLGPLWYWHNADFKIRIVTITMQCDEHCN